MKYLTLSFALLLAPFPVRATTLSGTITDFSGAVIPNAQVIVHWDSVGLAGVRKNVGSKTDKSVTADEDGHFSLELPPGVYDIFVAAAGFFPHCGKIKLKETATQRYEVKLKVSRFLTVTVD